MNKFIINRCHRAASKLIQYAAVKFTYQPLVESQQGHLKGTSKPEWGEPVPVNEPLVPVNSQTANALVNAQDGTADQYQFIWISHHDVPMKAKVTYKNQQFTIVDRGDYTELAGVFVYYLKGRSDVNEV